MSRRLVLVSSHFAPSNLVGGHRARLWSRYLPEFGWEPTVVTGNPRHYEEQPDPDLERLVAPGLEVVHAATLPVRPIKLVGDVGVRAFWGCYRAVADLVRQRRADFVLVTIPSNFLAPLGRLVHGRFGVPFGIVFAESLACGTPVISCPTGALPEILRQGVDGFLIKSIEEACEAVGKLGTIDRAACRRRAVEHFSADAVLTRYLELYTRLVGRKAA